MRKNNCFIREGGGQTTKWGADGRRVSTFCFSFWLHIQLEVINLAGCKSSTFILFINFPSVSRADEILLPPLRQVLNDRRPAFYHSMLIELF